MTSGWAGLRRDCATTFGRIRQRFPHLDDSAMALLQSGRTQFEAHLAATHQLTPTEAREEFADFLFVEALRNEIST